MSKGEATKFVFSAINTLLITALGYFYVSNHARDEKDMDKMETKVSHTDSLLTVIMTQQSATYLLDTLAHNAFDKRITALEVDVMRWDIEYLPYIDFRGSPWKQKIKGTF